MKQVCWVGLFMAIKLMEDLVLLWAQDFTPQASGKRALAAARRQRSSQSARSVSSSFRINLDLPLTPMYPQGVTCIHAMTGLIEWSLTMDGDGYLFAMVSCVFFWLGKAAW